MIQQELRIGNWVEKKQNSPLVYGKVTQVYMDGFTVDYHYPGGWYAPIQLDESILLKAGFTKHKNSNEFWNFWTLNNGWHIGQALHNEPSAGVETGYCYWGDDYIKVLHLHQLQNLIFALTGAELIINLEAQP